MVTGDHGAGEEPTTDDGIALPARPVLGSRDGGLGPRDVVAALAVILILVAGFGLVGGRPAGSAPAPAGSASIAPSSVNTLPTLPPATPALATRCSPAGQLPPITLRGAADAIAATGPTGVTGSVLAELQDGGSWPDPGDPATVHAAAGEVLEAEAGGACILASFARAARLEDVVGRDAPAPAKRIYLGGAEYEAAPQSVAVAAPPPGQWLVRIIVVYGRSPESSLEVTAESVFRVQVAAPPDQPAASQ